MNHLKILSIVDYVFAALTFLGLLLIGVATLLTTAAALSSAGMDALGSLIPSLVINVVMMVVLAGFGVLFAVAGRQVGKGRGRILQTILAVMSIMNCPVGTAFAAYSLWACWANPETVAAFSGGMSDDL